MFSFGNKIPLLFDSGFHRNHAVSCVQLSIEIALLGVLSDNTCYKNLIWGSVLDGSFQPKG